MAYTLGNIPADAPQWLVNELRKLQEYVSQLENGGVLNTLYAAPKKPREGLTVVADGTTWDPLTLALGHSYKVCYLGGAWRRDA